MGFVIVHTPLTGGGGWDPSDIPPPFIGDRSAKIFFFLLNFSVAFLLSEEEKETPSSREKYRRVHFYSLLLETF